MRKRQGTPAGIHDVESTSLEFCRVFAIHTSSHKIPPQQINDYNGKAKREDSIDFQQLLSAEAVAVRMFNAPTLCLIYFTKVSIGQLS